MVEPSGDGREGSPSPSLFTTWSAADAKLASAPKTPVTSSKPASFQSVPRLRYPTVPSLTKRDGSQAGEGRDEDEDVEMTLAGSQTQRSLRSRTRSQNIPSGGPQPSKKDVPKGKPLTPRLTLKIGAPLPVSSPKKSENNTVSCVFTLLLIYLTYSDSLVPRPWCDAARAPNRPVRRGTRSPISVR